MFAALVSCAASSWTARNVSYNAVGLLEEFVQVLRAEDVRLDGRGAVPSQQLVECQRDVHCSAFTRSAVAMAWNDEAPRGSALLVFRLGNPPVPQPMTSAPLAPSYSLIHQHSPATYLGPPPCLLNAARSGSLVSWNVSFPSHTAMSLRSAIALARCTILR